MSYVLAIEPNREQAHLLRDGIVPNSLAKVLVVESVGSAMSAIDREIPSVILVNALLPPQDENDLVERLRTLPRDKAPEILITPSLSRDEKTHAPAAPPRRLFGWRASRSPHHGGCTPLAFTKQLKAYLSFVEARKPHVPHAAGPEPVLALVPIRGPIEEDPAAAVTGAPEVERSPAERRASVRIERVEWARVLVNGTPVKVVDLSATGAQILSPTVLRLGGSVHVMLCKDAELLQCDAGIVWGAFDITKSAPAPLFRAGLSFKDADRSAIERLCMEPSLVRREGSRYEPKEW